MESFPIRLKISVRRERGLTRTPFILHHVRFTSRTFWTAWVSVTTSANRCRTRLCRRVRKSDEDEPRLGEEDRRANHKCVGILQTYLEVSTRHSFRSPRGRQDARIHWRCRPPKIATIWQVSVGNAETWSHDTKEQYVLNILMHTQMRTGVEI